MKAHFAPGAPNILTVFMDDHEACVLLGALEGIAKVMRRDEPPAAEATVPVPKLGPCDHRYMTTGQHVEGVRDDRREKCVKCGAERERVS